MLKFLLLILLTGHITMAQDFDFANRLYYEYEKYREETLKHRRFKHADIVPLIKHLENKNIFKVKKAGTSAEGRDIFLISAGTGKTRLFLWSQMHGDEPTATMALFDIFNFLTADDEFNNIRKELLSKLEIYFMPMVNPDGAEVYQRRNIFDIDINRDAVRQQTPEGKILRGTFESLKADFGFNLHDQSTRYSVGNSFRAATISFLAPTFNYEKDVNEIRSDAIKVIGQMFKVLSGIVPGHIAKYSDEFEPRAFGDNFQKWGTSTILIESGGWKDDPEKQFIRKLNFISLLTAFKGIADGSYRKENHETYEMIPFNDKYIMDVVLRNLTYTKNGFDYLVDIGINLNEVNTKSADDYYVKGNIEDVGDLSVYYGYEDIDLKGMRVEPGKTFPEEFDSIDEIMKIDFSELYKKGYTNVILNSEIKENYTQLPVNIILNKNSKYFDNAEIDLGEISNLVIKNDEQVKYVVINGRFLNVDEKVKDFKNGLIFH